MIFIVILSIVLVVSICGVIICYLFSNFISSGNNSGVTPTPNTVAVTTDAPFITTVYATEAQEDKTTTMSVVTVPRTTNGGQVDSPKPPPNDPPVEEPSLYFYEDSEFNDGIIIMGFNGDFTDSVLKIPEKIDGRTVTGIGEKAFTNNEYIEEIQIPDTVYSIDSEAFYNLYNLQRVYLGRNVNSIYDKAFSSEPCNYTINFYFRRYDYNSLLNGVACLGEDYEINFLD